MFPELVTAGDLESLCFNQVAEGLQLEFKEKEDASTGALSKNDQKAIAEVVSAFANSDGGTLIFGMRTQRRASVDVALELVPISQIDQFAASFRMVSSLNVSPQVSGLSVRVIQLDSKSDKGFLVCHVERSDGRPHMSTAPNVHRYYRRSFEGTVPMTPSEVRDQILAVREAVLEPVIVYGAGGSFSNNGTWISAQIPIEFRIKNVGRTACRNPFLRVRPTPDLHSYSATYDGALCSWKTTFPYGTIVHIDDQLSCFALLFNACIRLDKLHNSFLTGSDISDALLIFPGSNEYHIRTITDKISLDRIDLVLRHGAENAVVTEKEVSIHRDALAKRILAQPTVKDMFSQSGFGPFRQDLMHAFAES